MNPLAKFMLNSIRPFLRSAKKTLFYLFLSVSYITGLFAEGNLISGKVIAQNNKGIAGVVVSDGYTVTTTGKNGQYALPGNDSAQFVFISVPSDYEIPDKGGIPQFYREIKGKKNAVADFQLKKKKKDKRFVLTVMADPQSQIKADMNRFTTEAIPDIEQLRQQYPKKMAFVGMTVGDLVWDAPKLYPDYVKAFGQLSFPFYQVIGNHDHDETVANDDYAASHNYERYLGPTYYSFNRGDCHFVGLDNIVYDTRKNYETRITQRQLDWLRQDLAHVGKDKLIIVGMHAPAFRKGGAPITSNIDQLLSALQGYRVVFLSGHTHRMNKTIISDNVVEYTFSPAMGNSWAGDIGDNGCPNGYGVFEIKGNRLVNHYYKSTGQDAAYQMNLYPAGRVEEKPGSVVAHVWNYSEGWKVEVFENGQYKGEMMNYTGVDPVANDVYLGPGKPVRKPKLEPAKTHNLFYYTPEQPGARIKVVATDPFGNTYSETL